MDTIETSGLGGLIDASREAILSLRSRLSAQTGDLSRPAVQHYFQNRSLNDKPYTDLTAASSTTYRRLMRKAIESMAAQATFEEVSVLDYGCGRGNLLSLLEKYGFRGQYTGFDIDHVQIEKLQASSARDSVKFVNQIPAGYFTTVFLVNVLAYVADNEIDNLMLEICDHLPDSGRLVIAEPIPAWYWETRFAGLKLRLRSKSEIDQKMQHLGFKCVATRLVAVGRLGEKPIWPMSWIAEWQFQVKYEKLRELE